MGRVRAIETRRYVLRASNKCTSAIIDDRGRLAAAVPRFESAVLNGTARVQAGLTPCVRFGDWPVWASLAGLAALLAEAAFRRRRQAPNGSNR